jgi:WD40 repeat protein
MIRIDSGASFRRRLAYSALVWDPRLDRSEVAAREILSLRWHASGVTGIDVSRNQQTVVTSGADGKIVLWPADEL